MAITTKNRKQLKSYFVKNAIPTEGNFADLIDGTLNQAEDGVFKLPGEPLSVVAAPGEQKRALRFYTNYPAQNADWLISLSPAQDPNNPATARPGFGVTDGAGTPRLFIDAATGNVGVGTNSPPDRLTVSGGDVRIEGGRYRRLKIVSDQYWAGIELVARGKGEAGFPHIDFTNGDLDNPNFGLRLFGHENKALYLESTTGPATLWVRGDIGYDGRLNKLDTGEQFAATIRAADLMFGHTGRRGSPARAIVDNIDALIFNFAKDWPRAEIHSPLFVDGNVGVGTRTPAGPLEVRVAGSPGWDRLIVTADAEWGNGNKHVTLGAGGAAGVMFHNPHVSWIRNENRASIRYAHSGGVPEGAFWDVGARPGNAFSLAMNNSDQRLWLTGDGKIGVNTHEPAGALDIRVPGTIGGWDRLVVGATKLWGDGETHYVTIGAGGAHGIMIHNPHIPWIGGPTGRASIRYGRSGGVQGGAFWDVGARPGNQFSFALNGDLHALTLGPDGKVYVPANFEVGGSASLGYAQNVDNFNAPLRSGFYERNNPVGQVPDTASPWVHMIHVRHSNQANSHALQIAASYAQNDKLYFRKIARDLTPADNPWHEVAVAANVQKIRAGYCDTDSPALRNGVGERHVLVPVNFGYTFASPPQVLVALRGFDMQHDRNARLNAWPEQITQTGCVIKFLTWGDTIIWGAYAQWIAIGV